MPETRGTRARLASAYGAASTDTVDLLEAAGGDVAGGLLLLPEGRSPTATTPQWHPALERDIAARIRAIKEEPDDWAGPGPQRFSLAGTQGKFALSLSDGDWYWPNATIPSTHILKPARPDLRGLEAAEADALRLADRVGVPAPKAEVATFEDQTVLLVERFDRLHLPGESRARRIHTEDLAQAMGLSPTQKYAVTAR